MSTFPFNRELKNRFHRAYRIYKQSRKYKAKNYKSNIMRQRDNLKSENPKDYWKLINSLKERKPDIPALDPVDFQDHFDSSNSIQDKFDSALMKMKVKLNTLETNSKNVTGLDETITEKEIVSAIKKNKSNKSGGLQLITNDMLKADQNILAPILLKLYNSILSSGLYSDHWSTGYFNPIFKSGDRSKPENYRGITITGCLGKLLNSILNNRLNDFLYYDIFVLKTAIDKYICKKKKIYTCFIDFI
jgi:hypothetical protein